MEFKPTVTYTAIHPSKTQPNPDLPSHHKKEKSPGHDDDHNHSDERERERRRVWEEKHPKPESPRRR